MKKIITSIIGLALLAGSTNAQRYLTEVFTNVTVTSNVQYGSNYSVLTGSPVLQPLVMDVYEPAGDVVTDRPLIIYAHTGSFLPRYINQMPTGDKSDSATVEICTRLARQGYVVAAIDYRTGWNPQGTQDERTQTIIQAVYRSLQDSKTAVRYFRKDVATNGNSYGINPDKIAIGGQGSGGYISLAYATLNKLSELQMTKFYNFSTGAFMIDTSMMGNWDGYGGLAALNQVNHPGYSNDVSVVFNIGGAIGDSTWLEQGEVPIISMQGVADAFTPYSYGIVNVPATTLFVIDVSGSSDVIRKSNEFGNNDIFFTPAINDVWTTAANSHNTFLDPSYGNAGNEGLFGFPGAGNGNGPWEYWDDATVSAGATAYGQNPTTVLANGYSANPVYQALGPVAGRVRAHAYIDTIQGYLSPRLYRVFFENTTSVDENNMNDDINIYPNPAKDQINIELLSGDKILGLVIYNMIGEVVKEETNSGSDYFNKIDLNLNSGMYLINIRTQKGTITKKLVIK